MKQRMWNILKAFATGFVAVAIALWLLQIIAPAIGLGYEVGWQATFDLEKTAGGAIHVSWLTPLLVGLLFAVIQIFEDFESSLNRQYKKIVKTGEAHKALTVLWHGAWGLALGFVVSTFLLALMLGTKSTYVIPYVLEATADGASVKATTSIMTVFTILGIAWGVWKAEHVDKHKEQARKAKARRVKSKPVKKPVKRKPVKKPVKRKPVKKPVKRKPARRPRQAQ